MHVGGWFGSPQRSVVQAGSAAADGTLAIPAIRKRAAMARVRIARDTLGPTTRCVVRSPIIERSQSKWTCSKAAGAEADRRREEKTRETRRREGWGRRKEKGPGDGAPTWPWAPRRPW